MKLLLTKISELNGKLQRNQQKRFSFHAEAKQKNYKKENKLRKPYEALPFLLDASVLL